MIIEGDSLRMQNQYAKPLRNTSKKNLQTMSQNNRSEASLKTHSIPNNGKVSNMDAYYMDTEGSASQAIPAQESDVHHPSTPNNHIPRTKRSNID